MAGSAELADADVIVAADGVNSTVREEHADEFGTKIVAGRNKYVWLGTDKVFEGFTLAFEQTEAGWMWCHSYAYGPDSSTCIVECAPETWSGLGLDALPAHDSLTLLETVFQKPLDGRRLISPAAEDAPLPWLNFKTITNSSWHVDKTVLVGDAAHTTHFSIGSGTILALRDAIALADALQQADTPQSAFATYEKRQREALVPIQSNARLSARWFEQVGRYVESRRRRCSRSYGLAAIRCCSRPSEALLPALHDGRAHPRVAQPQAPARSERPDPLRPPHPARALVAASTSTASSNGQGLSRSPTALGERKQPLGHQRGQCLGRVTGHRHHDEGLTLVVLRQIAERQHAGLGPTLEPDLRPVHPVEADPAAVDGKTLPIGARPDSADSCCSPADTWHRHRSAKRTSH